MGRRDLLGCDGVRGRRDGQFERPQLEQRQGAGGDCAAPAAPGSLRQTLGLPHSATSTTPSGEGITVAVVDSGIAPLADLRISAFYDFTHGGIPTAPFDDYGQARTSPV